MELKKYIPRDISWLSFNYRVLLEAKNPKVPILERLRFIAIYSSNLDEFVRVRVAEIRSLIRIDKKKINKSIAIKPNRVLKAVKSEIDRQLTQYGSILRGDILPSLAKEGIIFKNGDDLTPNEQLFVDDYFRTTISAYLHPYVDGDSGREPFLRNQALYFGIRLKSDNDSKIKFGYVSIPSEKLPRFTRLPTIDEVHPFILLDEIVKRNLHRVFVGYEVIEWKAIKMNRDADLNIEDEYDGDLVEKIRKQIDKRDLGVPARFLYDDTMSTELLSWFMEIFGLDEDDLTPGGSVHNLSDYFQVPNPIGPELEYDKHPPISIDRFDKATSILSEIEQEDTLLHFPYQRYDYVLQFFNEAAIHPEVTSIKVAFYRMAATSLIGEALISAAKNGKEVLVFMEVKARFDEENNLKWANRFKEVGVKVIYSIPGLKVHAKIALITKKENDGTSKNFAFFGTGNLNEKTAKIYADYGLLTSKKPLVTELDSIFQFLHQRTEPKPFKKLLVSQFNIMERFIAMIDNEIALAKEGKEASMVIKLNNLEEKTMVDKLYEASSAGVKIRMIIRGICALRPGVDGLSENISIHRIVDRYLEHARVFIFYNGGNELIYLGSADWMNRNLHSRIEVVFPIINPNLKDEIKHVIQLQLNDNVSAVNLDADLNNVAIANEKAKVRSQIDTYNWLKEKK
ncbi:MAG: polyphosphate kinase 1 [Cyclobacteriaceae bacterium]